MKLLTSLLTAFTLLFITNTSYAKRRTTLPKCIKPATTPQKLNALLLGATVLIELERLEKEFADKGQELKIIYIARKGTDPGNVVTLRDYNKNGQLLSLKQIAESSGAKDNPFPLGNEDSSNNIAFDIATQFKDPTRKMAYSHIGVMVKNHPKQKWLVYHKLKPCDKEKSYLYDQGIGTFFIDAPYEYTVMLLVPKQQTQDAIEKIILAPEINAVQAYWDQTYNATTLPYTTKHLNSNSLPLELLAASQVSYSEVSQWPKEEFRQRAQQILKQSHYFPTKMSTAQSFKYSFINTPLAPSYVNVKAQKYRHLQMYEVVSALSVKEYMERNDLLDQAPIHIKIPEGNVFKEESPQNQEDHQNYIN